MNKFLLPLCNGLLFLILVGLAGCSGPPRLVASYSQDERQGTLSTVTTPVPPPYACHAILELEVGDVDRAVSQTIGLARAHGGHVLDSTTRQVRGGVETRMVLAVPAERIHEIRNHIVVLGSLNHESWHGEGFEPCDPGYARIKFAYLHVQFQERAIHLPAWPEVSWSPVFTFRRAFGVFIRIFGIIVDLLIWVLVVTGPFFLMAWGLIFLVRRFRR